MGAPASALRTRRLILRPPRPDDAPQVVALLNDWEVIKQTAALPCPFTEADAAAWIAADAAQMVADRIVLRRLITRADDGTPLGAIDLFERGGEPQVAYWIGRAHWSQGFATEAAAPFVAHVFATTALPRLRAGIFVENVASARVLEKLGFRAEEEHDIDTEYRGCRRRVRRYVLERP